MLRRRGLLGLLGAALVAPAVVRADCLMPVVPVAPVVPRLWGDGVHDDTAALQAMLDDAARRGGTVYLPPGTYRVQSLDLTMRERPVHLTGGGEAVLLRGDPSRSILAVHTSKLAPVSMTRMLFRCDARGAAAPMLSVWG